jgi:hypothetical protein
LTDLKQTIERNIVQRTGGRVRALEIVVAGDRIGIRGWVANYHLKQLIIQGLRDALGPAGPMHIDLDVQVNVRVPRSSTEPT